MMVTVVKMQIGNLRDVNSLELNIDVDIDIGFEGAEREGQYHSQGHSWI